MNPWTAVQDSATVACGSVHLWRHCDILCTLYLMWSVVCIKWR